MCPTKDKGGLLLTFGSPANPRHKAHVKELFPAPAKLCHTLSECAETFQVALVHSQGFGSVGHTIGGQNKVQAWGWFKGSLLVGLRYRPAHFKALSSHTSRIT